MNVPFTINNIIVFNALWCSLWVVELITDPLKLHAWDFGHDRTPIEAQGWRSAAAFASGLFVLCIWALKLPVESKKGFLQCMTAPYIAALLWLLNDKQVYTTIAWNAHVLFIGFAAILTFVGGFVLASERNVPLTKPVVPSATVEVKKVYAA